MPKSASLARGRTSYSEGNHMGSFVGSVALDSVSPDELREYYTYIIYENGKFTLHIQSISTKFITYTEHMGLLLSFPDHLSHSNRNLNRSYWIKWGSRWNRNMSCEILFLYDGTFGAECIPASWVGCKLSRQRILISRKVLKDIVTTNVNSLHHELHYKRCRTSSIYSTTSFDSLLSLVVRLPQYGCLEEPWMLAR